MGDFDFKVGDDVWWIEVGTNVCGPTIGLFHDIILSIENNGNLICGKVFILPEQIWGKTREEALARLKADLEQWDKLE